MPVPDNLRSGASFQFAGVCPDQQCPRSLLQSAGWGAASSVPV